MDAQARNRHWTLGPPDSLARRWTAIACCGACWLGLVIGWCYPNAFTIPSLLVMPAFIYWCRAVVRPARTLEHTPRRWWILGGTLIAVLIVLAEITWLAATGAITRSRDDPRAPIERHLPGKPAGIPLKRR